MKINLKNLYKIIKKNNYTILLVNCDKLEFLNKYKNLNQFKNKTLKNKRITYYILKLLKYKNN